MRDTVKVEVQGLSDLLANLQRLAPALARKLERRALKKALEPMKRAAEQNAPLGETGNLKKSFKLRSRGKRLFVSADLYTDPADAPHSHLVEFGHLAVKRGLLGIRRVVGHVPPHPYLRPAFEAKADEAIEIFADEVGAALESMESRR